MHNHIKQSDRVCIEFLLKRNYTNTQIGKELGFHRTTIQREVSRNKDTDGVYKTRIANNKTIQRKRKSKIKYRILDNNVLIKNFVLKYLKLEWSPEQISGTYGNISHMSVYRYLDRNKELKKYLRRHGKKRRKYGKSSIKSRYQANKRSIHDRCIDKQVIGNWEGDTIVGKERKLRIITHLDIASGYLVAKLSNATAHGVYTHTKQKLSKLPCKSITYDNGSEFALHRMIEKVTNAKVYFADPGKPHQRGANENVNGLLRQYFPKGSSFANIKDSDVQKAVRRINNRPRKRLNYLTPEQVFKGVRLMC
jgi:IS30 family transposase